MDVTILAIFRGVAPWQGARSQGCPPSPPASPALSLPSWNPVPVTQRPPPARPVCLPPVPRCGEWHSHWLFVPGLFTRHHVLTVHPCCGPCQSPSHVQAEEWRVLKQASSERKPRPRHTRVHQAGQAGPSERCWSSGRISAPSQRPRPRGTQGPAPSCARDRRLCGTVRDPRPLRPPVPRQPRQPHCLVTLELSVCRVGSSRRRGPLCVAFDLGVAHEQ